MTPDITDPQILNEPPTEAEIVAQWRPERGDLVSVCMLVYNHEPYLRDALNSILNQKTDFGFEILVHDDASQDASQSIIREYATRYPRIVKPILQSVNQHSQKIYPSVHFNYPRANLPFVAMCEGDDHWTDVHKLQLQVDGLQAHPEVDLSFHAAIFADYHEGGGARRIYGDYDTVDRIVPFLDIMHRIRGWIALAACMIRQSAKVRFLDFLKTRPYLTVGDIYFQLFGAQSGGALYIARPMSLYRYRTPQSWTSKTHLDPRFKATHEIAMIHSYIELDQMSENAYHQDFLALILQRLLWLFGAPLPPSDSLPCIPLLQPIHAACQEEIERTLQELKQGSGRYVIFGCASGCLKILHTLPPESVIAIIDRDNLRIGEDIKGHPVVGTHALGQYSDCDLIVSTIAPVSDAIFQMAGDAGIKRERVHHLFDGAISVLDRNPIPLNIFDLQ